LQHEGIVKKDIFGLLGCNPVALPILDGIGFIPIEANARREWICRVGKTFSIHHGLRRSG